MPWIISVLLGALLQLVGSLVGRALVALGLGFVEFVGLQSMINGTITAIKSNISSFDGPMAAWAGFFRIDVHISIIISAITMKLLLRSLNSDRVRKLAPSKK
jgi:hypothetical protein